MKKYRKEIDGIRAIAVLAVILNHAGIKAFSGGFVGVDVFFVISGYLITGIILSELQNNQFSIVRFYERRARRILPALFFLMGTCSIFAYHWMLPDELENFGQSLVATSVFANNILLTVTSGYWSLASEFKPLLHTWSLGVEEQYYALFPLFMYFGWHFFRKRISIFLTAVFIISLIAASWGAINMPTPTFYLLPTRCWELLIGSFVAFHTSTATIGATPKPTLQETLSLTGVGLILVSIFTFTKNTPSPSIPTLAPTIGTALVILYANEGTTTYKLLANRLMVGIGLISYSLYLWHYPLFAFAKIYSITPPSATTMLLCCIATLIISTLSWRFIEIPFRNKSKIGRHFIPYSIAASLVFIGFGYYLHISHGVPTRMYNDKATISADMYISYNERAFKFKKDTFDNTSRLNILVIGNSFARDFVNMTLENFDLDGIEIIYRDDLPECMQPAKSETFDKLYSSTNIIVFANDHAKLNCVDQNITKALKDGKNIFYLGTKHFGYNLNWLARLNPSQRRNKFNPLLPETAEEEAIMSNAIPKENLIDILSVININGLVPITDEMGQLISEDRTHLTRQGAIYVGKRALVKSKFGEILNAAIR